MATRASSRKDSSVDDEFLHQLYRGGELLAAGKVIEAKDYLEKAHKLQPKNEKGQNLLGLTYFKLGLFDRAAEIYEALVRENPADPTLRVNLGLVYLKTNALQRAIREFETATDLAPEHKKAQNYLGLALAQAGEYGKAREHFLLAGSDAMAEKMSRAIAGEGFEKPAVKSPAREKGFAEIEGSEVVTEGGGMPVQEISAEAPAAEAAPATPSERAAPLAQVSPPPALADAPPQNSDIQIDVMAEETEAATSSPPTVSTLGALGQQDWGAQFGFEAPGDGEAGSEATTEPSSSEPSSSQLDSGALGESAEAAVAPPMEEVMVEETAPSSRSEPVMEDLPSEAIPVEELQVDVSEPVSESTLPTEAAAGQTSEAFSEEAFSEQALSEEALSEEALATAPPEAGIDATSNVSVSGSASEPLSEPGLEDDPTADLLARAEGRLTPPDLAQAARMPDAPAYRGSNTLPFAPSTPERKRTAKEQPAPVHALAHVAVQGPPLVELGPSLELFPEPVEGPFAIREGAIGILVDGEILTRAAGMVAMSGKLELAPEMKRSRGRASDKPFGEGEQAMCRATGQGLLVVEPLGEQFTSVDLGDESAYFREDRVFAFEEPVMFENGRVPSEVPPDLDLVHLRGKGRVLLRLQGTLRAMSVSMERAITVPLAHLVGWHGNLTPRMVPLGKDAKGRPARAGVELSGEGFALVSVALK